MRPLVLVSRSDEATYLYICVEQVLCATNNARQKARGHNPRAGGIKIVISCVIFVRVD